MVGGFPVPDGKWPDAVLVVARDATCTGTLIAPDVVLTAGHCIEPHPVEVWTDTVDYSTPPGDRIPVAWSRAYPDWESSFDVGVIVLARPARPAPRIVEATCTARQKLVTGAHVRLVGFGLTTSDASDSNTQLREATLAITDPSCTSDDACQPAIAPRGEFIAGGAGSDACFGDSGGPVYVPTALGPALAGVVSRGLAASLTPCGGGGIFVRADRVASWVTSVTGKRLARTSCGSKGDEDEADDDAGGCSSTRSGPGALAVLVVLVVSARARRRRGV